MLARLWVANGIESKATVVLLVVFALAIVVSNALRFAYHPCTSPYGYSSRPADYHWLEKYDAATHDPVYYASDPQDGETVYVGPDGVYYKFLHAPPIDPADLHSTWCPQTPPQ